MLCRELAFASLTCLPAGSQGYALIEYDTKAEAAAAIAAMNGKDLALTAGDADNKKPLGCASATAPPFRKSLLSLTPSTLAPCRHRECVSRRTVCVWKRSPGPRSGGSSQPRRRVCRCAAPRRVEWAFANGPLRRLRK